MGEARLIVSARWFRQGAYRGHPGRFLAWRSAFGDSRHERPAARCDWPDHGQTFRWRGIEDDAAIAFLIESPFAFGIEAGANSPVHVRPPPG